MRQLFSVVIVGLAGAVLWADDAGGGKVEVKGPHICCGQCVKIATKILNKIEGVSEARADIKGRTVTFTAKDGKAAKAGFKALVDGGFFGAAAVDGKEIKLSLPAPKKGEKADTVAVKDVHVCCGQCQKAINKIFTDSKVSYEGKGPQKTVRIEGTGLDRAEVLDALKKAGFFGKIAD